MGALSVKGQDARVGRYTIQGEIATGGMATVHYGRLVGPAGFTRGVAIKRLHPQFAKNPDFVAMFLDEARLASRIQHPNVVPILDVVAEGAELFLVMEFVPGESLSKLVKSAPGGLPITIALSLAVGMLEGLHAAHKALGEDGKPLMIVHRDVSPQNVIVGVDGIARLIDFGVAKATGNATMTRDGQVKGKVAYMAPEQLRSEPVDCRADIYAASVVLWEMLTGKRFFGSADSEAALMLRVLNEAITHPSVERKEVPPELDAVVLKGLSRDAKDRFGSAQEMVQALERVAQPAAARDVARWVELKAGEAVAMRAQALADFDASVATELPGQASAEVLKRSRVSAPTLAAPEIGASSSTQAGQEKQRTGLFVAIAIVLAGGIGFYASRLVSSPGAAPIASTATSAGEPVKTGEPASSATAVPAASSALPPPSAPPSASMSAKAHTATGPRPSSSVVKPARPSCNPPYVITADGLKQYKPECLR
jgi:eukaryotic-like serine/threonine-protein kinase